MWWSLLCQNQHEDLKKQYYELQDQHHAQGEDHNRLLDEHRTRYDKLQQIKDTEASQLKGTDSHRRFKSTAFVYNTELHYQL